MAICKMCGDEFQAKRSTAKYCSVACRVAYNRLPSVDDRVSDVLDALQKITSLDPYGDLSYERAVALKSIAKFIDYELENNVSSWWRCRGCGLAVRKELPSSSDCQCSSPQWILQKTMI